MILGLYVCTQYDWITSNYYMYYSYSLVKLEEGCWTREASALCISDSLGSELEVDWEDRPTIVEIIRNIILQYDSVIRREVNVPPISNFLKSCDIILNLCESVTVRLAISDH